jgi:ABC-type transport system substrate-binding protein
LTIGTLIANKIRGGSFMKKVVSIIVLVAMLVGVFSIAAYANSRYLYILDGSASLTISGGTAQVSGSISTFNPNTINIKLELERKPSSGGSWDV